MPAEIQPVKWFNRGTLPDGKKRPTGGSTAHLVQPAPKRIQRSRKRGWTMPKNAVYVGRPTRWGNPWCVCRKDECDRFHAYDVAQAVTFYGEAVELASMAAARGASHNGHVPTADEICRELAGKDLVCWCPVGSPCHADVLLRIANPDQLATPERTQQ